jgi:hypothetical protein
MSPERNPPARRALAALLSAALLLPAAGTGARAAFVAPVESAGAVSGAASAAAGAAAVAPGASALPLLAPGTVPLSAPPAVLPAPSASVSADPARGGAAAPLRAAAPAAAAPAEAALPALPAAAVPVPAAPAVRALASVRAAAPSLPAAGPRSAAESAADGRTLFDGAARLAASDAPAPDETPSAAARPRRSLLRRALPPVAAAGGLAALGAAGWRLASGPAALPLWKRALNATGWTGYQVGNALAFVFAVPQIHQTLKDGGASKTPAWRAWSGAAASLTLGLVMGPLTGHPFWAVQNVFSGLTLLAPPVLGRFLQARGLKLSGRTAWLATVLGSAALMIPSLGLYYGAAAVAPALLKAALGAHGVRLLALGLQIVTGGVFFLLFAPDAAALLRGKAPKSFTPLFSLLFFAAATGFVAWTLQMAAQAAAGSPERVQYLVYAAQNALYAVVSFVSYWAARAGRRAA